MNLQLSNFGAHWTLTVAPRSTPGAPGSAGEKYGGTKERGRQVWGAPGSAGDMAGSISMQSRAARGYGHSLVTLPVHLEITGTQITTRS